MTDMNSLLRRRARRGFTLIEIMVVVVILGILAALVAPNVMRRIDDAQITKVKQDLRAFETALNLYKMDNYKYPTTEQGLKALTRSRTIRRCATGSKAGISAAAACIKDPWQNDYIYVYPGQHGEYDIYTLGADAQEGGEGVNADRGNWLTE